MTASSERRVAVVTGGATGIGAGIAEALARAGTHVVVLDANVSLDGSASADADGPSVVERITAAGGEARAVHLSVTDADGVRDLFEGLVAEHGSLDAVVNAAGISRPTGFARGSEDDWRAVLHVHLEGYLTVLRAALPLMAAAGHGRIVGVTSGSGWRAADAGAYGCAKRAVAALTWQLGADPPPGVTVNALSPIAATRMVAAALGRAPAGGDDPAGGAARGGIVLEGFPPPEDLGPVGAHLASEEFSWCSGRVLFSAGAELAVVGEPRLIEVVRSRPVASPAAMLSAVVPGALVPAEATQSTGGGAVARFADAFDAGSLDESAEVQAAETSCLVVTDDADMEAGLVAALRGRDVRCRAERIADGGFDAARTTLRTKVADGGEVDAVVLAVGFGRTSAGAADGPSWRRLLDDHDGLPARLLGDAAWMRAVADHGAEAAHPVRFVGLVDATTPGGRSRAQAVTQLSRAARGATDDRVSAAIVSVETADSADHSAAAALVAHLVVGADTEALSGAELCVGDGWIGLRSHPAPTATVNYGGPEIPGWLDDALEALVGEAGTTRS